MNEAREWDEKAVEAYRVYLKEVSFSWWDK
jgi:hypothetical protein